MCGRHHVKNRLYAFDEKKQDFCRRCESAAGVFFFFSAPKIKEENFMMSYVLLLVGFVLLIKGADYFVEGSSSVA